MKEVTDADPPQAHLLPLWLESSLTLVAWNLSVALTKKENSQVLCIFAGVFDKNPFQKKYTKMANHLCVCSFDGCRAERGNLTRWSVAAPWSRLSRPPGDGSSSPPAPHTLSCSLAGNIQNRCGTERSLKKHAVTFTFPSSHWVRVGPCQSQRTQTHTTHSHLGVVEF